jgi:8-oxo-dGTP diphosphatase
MLERLLGFAWRSAPKVLRRWSVRLTQQRFTVTVGAVVIDEGERVLLLKHVFRPGGMAWGIPGGFVEHKEQPEDALRRELREEIGLEVEQVEIAFARTLKNPKQLEIVFRCRPRGVATPQSIEIESAAWFAPRELPDQLTRDQRQVIERALKDGA